MWNKTIINVYPLSPAEVIVLSLVNYESLTLTTEIIRAIKFF